MVASGSRDGEGTPLEEGRVFLPAERLRDIVLVKAFEEADPEGRLLPRSARAHAGDEARAACDASGQSGGAARIAERARRLADLLREKFGLLEALRRAAPSVTRLNPLVCLGAFALGLSMNALGPERRINVLSFPLLFVIAWNLVVYVLLVVERVRPEHEHTPARTPLGSAYAWLAAPERPWRRLAAGFEHERHVADALRRFAAAWWRVGRPLHRARIERGFHAASALLALGTVAGMYVRGLALSYELTWESTFLDRDAVQRLVAVILGPADALLGLGTELPAEGASAPAAPWIHLYAVTALLSVILPRALLFAARTRSARRLERELGFDPGSDGYYLRLLASDRGEGRHVAVWCYSYRPPKLAEEGLRTLLLDVFGNRARLEPLHALDYGAEWEELSGAKSDADSLVLVFNGAQSPEQEVHGHFLEGARAALGRGEAGARVLIVVDETRYRERMGESEDGERRMTERRRAWERLVREAGFRAAFLRLETASGVEDLDSVRAAIQGAREVSVG